MYWKEVRRTEHFEEYHKGTLAWSDVVSLIHTIKNILDNKFYILCEIKNKILYVINVKRK